MLCISVLALFSIQIWSHTTRADSICPRNEVPSNCTTSCPGACENGNAGCAQSILCQTGCDCKSGYLRNQQKECVPESTCRTQAICPASTQSLKCGHWCSGTCRSKSHRKLNCFSKCRTGCTCNKGEFYDEIQGKCVLESNCSSEPDMKCPINEEFKSGNILAAECRCSGCELKKGPRCFCKPGFVRHKDGRCDDTSFCFNNFVCKLHDEFSEYKPCNKSGSPHCLDECTCMKGYVHDKFKKCIRSHKRTRVLM